jgi:general secretion pathway protein K
MDRLPSTNSDKSREGERGIALIVVLFVVATLSILVLEFVHSSRINLYIAGNIADGMKAMYLGKSGVAVAAGALLDDAQNSKDDSLDEDWAQVLPAIPAGEGWVTVEIIDEASKFNINRLVRKSGLPNTARQDVFRKLLEMLELDPELINPIIDWIDKDEESQNGGPEDSTYGYSAGADPFPSKNSPFLSMNELTLLYNMSPENYEKLKPYITIYGDTKLNMNTVEDKVLEAYVAVLSGEDDSTAAQDIITWRDEDENTFKKKTLKKQLTRDIGIDAPLAKKLNKHFSTKSRFFSVKVEAIVAESVKRCLGVIQRDKKRARIIYFRPL